MKNNPVYIYTILKDEHPKLHLPETPSREIIQGLRSLVSNEDNSLEAVNIRHLVNKIELNG